MHINKNTRTGIHTHKFPLSLPNVSIMITNIKNSRKLSSALVFVNLFYINNSFYSLCMPRKFKSEYHILVNVYPKV